MMGLGVSGTNCCEAMRMVRSTIKLLIFVVFLGYMAIWIMMPTNTFYLHWFPKIHARTNSTYFGQEGSYLLIYTFPILFIAAMACLYLHIVKKQADHYLQSKMEKSHFGLSWKRPVLVRGPLGIVSWTELSFAAMFIALLVWSLYAYLHAMFAYAAEEAAFMRERVWEAKLASSGLALGLVGNVCLAFLFFPVTRGSSILQLVGLTSEASIKYHIWVGNIAMTLFTVHGLCYIIFWAKTKQLSQMLKWDKHQVSNVAGEMALVSGLIMWVTTLTPIRRKIFELFFYTHNLYVAFVVFYIFHTGFTSSCVILPGFYLFLIDRHLRLLQSQQKVRLVSARLLPCETVELNFSKNPDLRYTPTSTLFINVPSISKLQWHPFTITSSCNMDPGRLSIVVKSGGSWSDKLCQTLSSPSPVDRLDVSIEGPYGPTSTHLTRHDMLVMISGGSGITPFISIIRELLFRANTENGRTPRVLLICAFKNSLDLTMLDLLLPISGTTLDISRLQLRIEAYVTRETELIPDSQKLSRTIWFKPSALDEPVSAVLGPNSWLWLGSIISCSFVIFLVLIGILTRYYIYPIDHNTNTKYPIPSRSALNMLVICVSIAMAATAAFLWNEKQNAKDMRLIQSTDMITPTTSPGLWSYDAGRELENFPSQSLLQATNVHLGERPNLRKILAECNGTSVGVLASGPKKMRQEVGEICSSGSTDNLQFESISFTW